MNSFSESRRRTLRGLAAVPALGLSLPRIAAAHAPGATLTVTDFDAATWAELLRSGPRPAAYVFTTTWCSSCPAVFEQMHAYITKLRRKADLVAVLMDAQGERALAHARHYQGLTRLFVFNGFEPAIRQAVDPKWRNITPYVALLGRDGSDQRVIGPPGHERLRAWLA